MGSVCSNKLKRKAEWMKQLKQMLPIDWTETYGYKVYKICSQMIKEGCIKLWNNF